MGESAIWPRGVPRVDQTAERSPTIEPTDIERFTQISGDRNPLHYDEEVARSTRFGEIVVQGGVTSVTRDDRTVVLDGDAVCYTFPLG